MIRRTLGQAAVILASGYILFFFSERAFWSFRRPGDTTFDHVITWLAYSLIGWIYLDLVRRSRAASFSSIFLCGAVYGWVAEGVVVDTLYGDASNPFPLSVSWTGLAWHALLTVGVGWFLLGKALAHEKPARAAWLSLAIGLGWGLWAAWWPNELGQGEATSVGAFAGSAFLSFLPFLASWLVLGLARPDWFRSGRIATVFLWGLAALLFGAARVPTRPAAVLILPPLLVLCGWALRRNARNERRDDAIEQILGRVRPRNVAVLLVIPSVAVAVYALFHALRLFPPTNYVLYLVTTPLGFVLFVRALWVNFRPAVDVRGDPPSVDRARPPDLGLPGSKNPARTP